MPPEAMKKDEDSDFIIHLMKSYIFSALIFDENNLKSD